MKNVLVCMLLAALALAVGCSKSASTAASDDSDGDGSSQGDLITRLDQHGDEILASITKGEAREWMKGSKHVFFKADPKVVAQFVEDFYQAGATQVYIGDIETEQGYDYGESLLVVLPKDPAARAKLFQVETRADTEFEDDPVTDKGQKYLYNGLD